MGYGLGYILAGRFLYGLAAGLRSSYYERRCCCDDYYYSQPRSYSYYSSSSSYSYYSPRSIYLDYSPYSSYSCDYYNDSSYYSRPAYSYDRFDYSDSYYNGYSTPSYSNGYYANSSSYDYGSYYSQRSSSSAYTSSTGSYNRINTQSRQSNTRTSNNTGGDVQNITYRVDTKYSGTAADIDRHLSGVLAGKGNIFMQAQEQYGINAAILAAICRCESGNGTSDIAKERNNVGGVRERIGPDEYDWKTYESVDACIMDIARFLKSGYIDIGLVTLSQVGGKYCPVADKTDKTGENKYWAQRVYAVYKEFI